MDFTAATPTLKAEKRGLTLSASTSVESQRPQEPWTPLDEAVSQAWVAKGRALDQRSSTRRIKVVKWVSIAGMFAASGLLSNGALFEGLARFLVTASALAFDVSAFRAACYLVAVAFGALALYYKLGGAGVSSSRDWQPALKAASAVPFSSSLVWPSRRNRKGESND